MRIVVGVWNGRTLKFFNIVILGGKSAVQSARVQIDRGEWDYVLEIAVSRQPGFESHSHQKNLFCPFFPLLVLKALPKEAVLAKVYMLKLSKASSKMRNVLMGMKQKLGLWPLLGLHGLYGKMKTSLLGFF